jgi:acetyl esterase/lipase
MSHRIRSLWLLYRATINTTLRHLLRRSAVNGWSWNWECSNVFLREQMKHAFSLGSVVEAREFVDSLTFNPMEMPEVGRRPANPGEPAGDWYIPHYFVPGRMMLYFHGGGYAFYTKSHAHMIALVAEATATRLFAVNYRLTPEHPCPAQIEDAIAAYRWLLGSGVPASSIILAGDSAGGHLTLMTLLELRKLGMPQPALAVGLCPWTDIGSRGKSLFDNDRYDWVQGAQTLTFSEWYRGKSGLSVNQGSPIHGDFRQLAPIYLQAGEKEILHDMICDFADAVRRQPADVTLDIWKNMTHDFQAYGNMLPESRDALLKLGVIVDRYASGGRSEQAFDAPVAS